MTSMPPPWDPDEGETEETRILPPRDDTAETRPLPRPPAPRPPRPPARARERVVLDEEGPPPSAGPPRGRGAWPWLLLLLGLVAALVAALWWFSQDDDEEAAAATRPVPSVLRLEVDEARGILLEQGFAVEVLRRASDEAPQGVVFRQRPEPGTRAEEGSTVRLTVSVGPASATVPDVVGQTQEEATAALREVGLRARVAMVPAQEEPGTVVAQAPQGGAEVERGSAVRLNVSGGPGAVRVPDVGGMSEAEAVAELEAAGLRAETGEVESDEPRGTVVAQEPAAGTDVDRGTAVRLDVSAGPAPVAVPDVTGLPQDDATAELEGLGFRVRVVEEPAPDPAQVGTVLRQVPAAGREAPPGTRVTVVVGL